MIGKEMRERVKLLILSWLEVSMCLGQFSVISPAAHQRDYTALTRGPKHQHTIRDRPSFFASFISGNNTTLVLIISGPF